MATVTQREIADFLGTFLVPSEWGKSDCLSMVVGYLGLFGRKLGADLPSWVRTAESEQEAMDAALSLFKDLTDAYLDHLELFPGLFVRMTSEAELRGVCPPAIGITAETGIRIERFLGIVPGASLAVLAWDGWWIRGHDGILRLEEPPVIQFRV